jgi:hypothetical protein
MLVPKQLLLALVTLLFVLAIFPFSTHLKFQQIPGLFGFGEEVITKESTEKSGDSSGAILRIISTQEVRPGKNLWDVLELIGVLAVPLLLFYLGGQLQRKDREIAETRLREDALQQYLDRVSELLLKSRSNNPDDRNLPPELIEDMIRTRTLTILRSLDKDGERKGSVIRFLVDAGLIKGYDSIDLSFANLSGANLREVVLTRALLQNADLSHANLSSADLSYAELNNANLCKANLTEADLEGAKLYSADLTRANLNLINLTEAKINNTDFKDVLSADTVKGLSEEQIKAAKNFPKKHMPVS